MHDYGGLITRTNGRLSEDEAFILTHVDHFGSDGYPIRKLGRKWSWGPMRSITGPPCVFKTKREAMQSFEQYLDILRDKIAGRIS